MQKMGQNEEIKNMSELKPRITENGIDYILVGDYYIPDLKLEVLDDGSESVICSF